MRERERNVCFQTMRVRMKCKNAFSAFLDVTAVFYVPFYPRFVFGFQYSRGEVTVVREREILGVKLGIR